ncbi:hypothetical protein PLEOSDRAFT_20533 [Pleurotus ostreatus PC15]|uniref:Cyclin N-terminal domain-containing protein n=1 Tax=Pleurotus ostreatus (strain PC15) TaxID=1137138 RepID=A0A067PB38_PLEO1|nr:hypothetical protein PLEOSDRAFT_20533 [Pleurotus ostreatus PC15]
MDFSPCSSTSSFSSTTSSTLSSSSSNHAASLVHPSLHSPAIMDLIDVKISRSLIDYMVDCVAETVDYAMGRPSPSSSHRGRKSRRSEYTKFTTFVTNVITRAEVATPVYLAALVYIDRARPHLHIALEEWALERVFLGSLIVASKYLNDSTLKNVHWALCTGVFGKRDVGRIEREFLDVLDFELAITEDDILAHYDDIAAIAITPYSIRSMQPVATEYNVQPTKRHTRNNLSVHIPLPGAVPELSYSSPESASSDDSSFSSSPATPSTLNSDSDASPATSPERETCSKDDSFAIPKSGLGFTSTTMELLRAFPIPLPPVAHHQRDKGIHSRFPIRLTH